MKNIKYFIVLLLLFNSTLFAYKVVEIDLAQQRIYAKQNGKTMFSGAISSGNRKHRTPSGNFSILGKDRYHYSNKYPEPYGGASMPYMLRLTYTGIAIHQGYLPGYPASHGCIRVSHRTAKKLWSWTRVGTPVVVYERMAVTQPLPRYKKKRTYKKKRYTKRSYKKNRYKKKRYRTRSYKKRNYKKRNYIKRSYKKRSKTRYRKKAKRNTRYKNNYSPALRRIIFR